MKLFQGKLKMGKKGIPLVGKASAKVDQLIGKTTALTTTVEAITGKEIGLDEKINGFGEKLNDLKTNYESKVANVDQLKKQLLDLITEKSGLKAGLEDAMDNLDKMDEQVKDLSNGTIFLMENLNASTKRI